MSAKLISIVLPVYRQADHIAGVVDAYVAALQGAGLTYELLLVVNGPEDGSWAACEQLAATRAGVRALRSDPAGWGQAVRTGLVASRGDPVCYTNSARTTGADLVQILQYGLANADTVVKATRKLRASVMRRLGSLAYNLECRTLFNLHYWDINGTPKVFPRRFDKLLDLQRMDDLVDLEFCAVCRREGYRMLDVPVPAQPRHGGKSTTRLASAWHMYAGAWRMWRQWRGEGRL